jgi:hypothetical protein
MYKINFIDRHDGKTIITFTDYFKIECLMVIAIFVLFAFENEILS